jgi:hypothetical protein
MRQFLSPMRAIPVERGSVFHGGRCRSDPSVWRELRTRDTSGAPRLAGCLILGDHIHLMVDGR